MLNVFVFFLLLTRFEENLIYFGNALGFYFALDPQTSSAALHTLLSHVNVLVLFIISLKININLCILYTEKVRKMNDDTIDYMVNAFILLTRKMKL